MIVSLISDNRLVDYLHNMPFAMGYMPDVVVWGDRVFARRAGSNAQAHYYDEVFAYVVPRVKEKDGE